MKRIAIAAFVIGVVALGIVSISSWRQDEADPIEKTPGLVLSKGVPLKSTVDAEQEGLISSLVEAGQLYEKPDTISVDYPLTGSIFPPEIIAPTFLWRDESAQANRWLIEVVLDGGSGHIYILADGDEKPEIAEDLRCYGSTNKRYTPTAQQAAAKRWTPDPAVWEAIKAASVGQPARLAILGFDSNNPQEVLSRGQMTLTTSADPVEAPIFYRDVPLMPDKTEAGVIKPLVPRALPLIAWRLKDISRSDSRVVLTDMPTCANCHSFSADGQTLGMDIDGPTGDKGAYAIAQIEREMSIGPDEIMTWNSFPDKPEGHKTIGFGSQVSPDGRYAMSTVNEQVYVANFTDYRFLQVFYPTGGILAYYSRETKKITALPGADDPEYVHCNPAWTPDGKTIVFSRAEAVDRRGHPLARYAGDPDELPMQYDLYRIPFKNGQGGRPQPIEGASANGVSNTFPKVSPDGKWIVFVKCKNGQLMRPDGRLWIVPVEGGQAREMTCNTSLMNSWHSFSPNARWMVFSSKMNTPYTQMFLTHIDEEGNDSPPILISNATSSNRAVNLPEFVNIGYDDLVSISAPSVEYYRHLARGNELSDQRQYQQAMVAYRKALALEPDSTRINNNLGTCLARLQRFDEAMKHFDRCLETDPQNALALFNGAEVLTGTGRLDQAVERYRNVLEYHPEFVNANIRLGMVLHMQGLDDEAMEWLEKALAIDPGAAAALHSLGEILDQQGRHAEAMDKWREAIKARPDFVAAYGKLGAALDRDGHPDEAIAQYRKALAVEPRNVNILNTLGIILARQEQYDEAIEMFSKAIDIDPNSRLLRENLRAALAQKNR